jgi:hypothetical protein
MRERLVEMVLKRYEMIVSQSGNHMQEKTDGDWVDADEAQAEIDRLRHDLGLYRDAMQSFVMNELPPSDPDPISPGEFVILNPSHMDHEGYREAVRVAAALIGMKRLYE